jgi:hypothetical protein
MYLVTTCYDSHYFMYILHPLIKKYYTTVCLLDRVENNHNPTRKMQNQLVTIVPMKPYIHTSHAMQGTDPIVVFSEDEHKFISTKCIHLVQETIITVLSANFTEVCRRW